jgi:hypothetical protein
MLQMYLKFRDEGYKGCQPLKSKMNFKYPYQGWQPCPRTRQYFIFLKVYLLLHLKSYGSGTTTTGQTITG